MSRDEKDKGFVVIDKRGRDEEDPEEAAPGRQTETRQTEEPGKAHGTLPKLDFSTFTLSLATSAMLHLGLVPDPETRKPAPVNRELARHSIDALEMLQEKTRGNLSDDERQLLQNLLTDLRMRYVEAKG